MRLGQKVITILVFLAVTSMTVVLNAQAEIYVDASNTSGIEDGSLTNPYNTIQEGLDAAPDYHIVSVAPGIYYGAIEFKSNAYLISQRGPNVTIIDGMAGSQAIFPPYVLTPRVNISGFTIRNANRLIIFWNRVNFWGASYLTINNCIFMNGNPPFSKGIEINPRVSASITRTLFKNVDRAIDAIWCPAPLLKNVTVDKVGSALVLYQIQVLLYNTTVSNTDSVVTLWGWNGSGIVYGSHNNFFNYEAFSTPNWQGHYPSIYLTNSLYADPMFIDPDSGNYHLQEESLLIDAGLIIGGIEFFGDAPDIGAYESDYGPGSILEQAEELAESYQGVPPSAFKNAGEQRRNAINNKFMAVLNLLNMITEDTDDTEKLGILKGARNMLEMDIWAKADGFYGGNPEDDWITTEEEQERIYDKVMELFESIDAEIDALSGS